MLVCLRTICWDLKQFLSLFCFLVQKNQQLGIMWTERLRDIVNWFQRMKVLMVMNSQPQTPPWPKPQPPSNISHPLTSTHFFGRVNNGRNVLPVPNCPNVLKCFSFLFLKISLFFSEHRNILHFHNMSDEGSKCLPTGTSPSSNVQCPHSTYSKKCFVKLH